MTEGHFKIGDRVRLSQLGLEVFGDHPLQGGGGAGSIIKLLNKKEGSSFDLRVEWDNGPTNVYDFVHITVVMKMTVHGNELRMEEVG